VSRPRALYYEVLRFSPGPLRALEERFALTRLPDPGADTDAALARCEVLFAPPGYPVDAAKLDRCPRLRVIASSTLTTPHVDCDAAAARGVRVVCLAGQHDVLDRVTATAELAWGLAIALTRHLPWAADEALHGPWRGRHWGEQTPRMLSNMRLGIVGLGRLGRLVAGYGLAFGMQVAACSPHSRMAGLKIIHSLNELAQWADMVSVHAALTPETEGMIGDGFLRALGPEGCLVNTARGELVDEDALLRALQQGTIAGAALDVLAGMHRPEFPAQAQEHPLVRHARTHRNCIVTPYYGGATRDAWEMTQTRTVELAAAAAQEGRT
jgi:D-3-phosphoglycerate dehydrogenase